MIGEAPNYISIVSAASDRYGNKLIELMEKFDAKGLSEISQEQAKQYCEEQGLVTDYKEGYYEKQEGSYSMRTAGGYHDGCLRMQRS